MAQSTMVLRRSRGGLLIAGVRQFDEYYKRYCFQRARCCPHRCLAAAWTPVRSSRDRDWDDSRISRARECRHCVAREIVVQHQHHSDRDHDRIGHRPDWDGFHLRCTILLSVPGQMVRLDRGRALRSAALCLANRNLPCRRDARIPHLQSGIFFCAKYCRTTASS